MDLQNFQSKLIRWHRNYVSVVDIVFLLIGQEASNIKHKQKMYNFFRRKSVLVKYRHDKEPIFIRKVGIYALPLVVVDFLRSEYKDAPKLQEVITWLIKVGSVEQTPKTKEVNLPKPTFSERVRKDIVNTFMQVSETLIVKLTLERLVESGAISQETYDRVKTLLVKDLGSLL